MVTPQTAIYRPLKIIMRCTRCGGAVLRDWDGLYCAQCSYDQEEVRIGADKDKRTYRRKDRIN